MGLATNQQWRLYVATPQVTLVPVSTDHVIGWTSSLQLQHTEYVKQEEDDDDDYPAWLNWK